MDSMDSEGSTGVVLRIKIGSAAEFYIDDG